MLPCHVEMRPSSWAALRTRGPGNRADHRAQPDTEQALCRIEKIMESIPGSATKCSRCHADGRNSEAAIWRSPPRQKRRLVRRMVCRWSLGRTRASPAFRTPLPWAPRSLKSIPTHCRGGPRTTGPPPAYTRPRGSTEWAVATVGQVGDESRQFGKVVLGPVGGPLAAVAPVPVIPGEDADQLRRKGQGGQGVAKGWDRLGPQKQLAVLPKPFAGVLHQGVQNGEIAVAKLPALARHPLPPVADLRHVEVQRAVDAQTVDRAIAGEDRLGAVAVMDVPIDHQDAREA